MLKWTLIVVGSLVAIVVLMALIGLFFPRGHVASVRVRIARPAPDVWAAIRDFAAWPSWNPDVRSMERLPDRDGRERWQLSDSTGGFPSLVETSEPPTDARPGRLVTRIDDPDLPFGGTWTWEVAPDGEGAGTTVTVTEDGEVTNPVFRFLANTVFGFHGSMEKSLRALAAKFGEAGATERVR